VESDEIVAAMRELRLPVTYVLDPNAGHGLLRPENRLSFFAITTLAVSLRARKT